MYEVLPKFRANIESKKYCKHTKHLSKTNVIRYKVFEL